MLKLPSQYKFKWQFIEAIHGEADVCLKCRAPFAMLPFVQVSAYSDYALRILMHAALHPRRVTVDEVAETYNISRHHLVKIVHQLGRKGYLATYRGIGGGFHLARPAKEISVGEIVRLGEGRETAIECVYRREGPCRIRTVCRLQRALDEAAVAFFDVLDRYSVADLVVRPAALLGAMALAQG